MIRSSQGWRRSPSSTLRRTISRWSGAGDACGEGRTREIADVGFDGAASGAPVSSIRSEARFTVRRAPLGETGSAGEI
jgi:hypothetical protein